MIPRRRQRFHKLKVVPYRHPKFRWTITGHYVNGKRVRRFFESRGEAEAFKQQLFVKQENLGTTVANIDLGLAQRAIKGEARLRPYKKTLDDAIEHYIRHLEALSRSCTVSEAIEMMLRDKRSDGKGDRYLQELRLRLGRFGVQFGTKIIAGVLSRDVDDWLRQLDVAPPTRNNYRRILFTFFSYALMRGFCEENPVAQTTKVKIVARPIGVLTPQQTESLLKCADTAIRPALAIGAFAGLRTAEIARLDWREVKLDRGYIEVTAAKSKTASRRLVKILPNLKEWLESSDSRSGAVLPPNSRKLIDAARIRAGLDDWPSNALRHSYASYHLAKFQDAASLALEMGHTTTGMLFSHYREVVTPEDGQRFWQIAP